MHNVTNMQLKRDYQTSLNKQNLLLATSIHGPNKTTNGDSIKNNIYNHFKMYSRQNNGYKFYEASFYTKLRANRFSFSKD